MLVSSSALQNCSFRVSEALWVSEIIKDVYNVLFNPALLFHWDLRTLMAVYYKSASQKGEHMQTPGQQGETIPIFLSGEGLGKPTLISLVYMQM